MGRSYFLRVWLCDAVPGLVPRPHLRERVWWHSADSSGFINVDYFPERNFSPPVTLQKTQSVVQHRKFLASSARWHSTFLARKLLVISSQLCIQQAMSFNEAQGISAGCHQTLSARVGSGDETSGEQPLVARARVSVCPRLATPHTTNTLVHRAQHL